MRDRPIIVFDSGRGGESIYVPLSQALPTARILYLDDHEHFPYGNKSAAWLSARFQILARRFKALDPILIVLACNTATVNVIAQLRLDLTCPVIGVEPVIKPLASYSRALALMTSASACSDQTRALLSRYGQHVRIHTPIGLAEAIEYNDSVRVKSIVHEIKDIVRQHRIQAVGLSCTHYPLILPDLRRAIPGVVWIDPGNAVVAQVLKVLKSL